tara:strand:- start:217 stop:1215 length:999 start_codon:yes stop_codon:yes gene_type:complete
MDPLTQGIVATAATQSISLNKKLFIISIVGFLSGLAPDIDIFIRSKEDPLLFLEFHRQFTHSLFFIPIGGLICCIFFYHLFTKRFNFTFKETYIYATTGYATHGIIDSFTTYGTQLLWPFTNERFAWNTISVIDPLFTIPVIILCSFALLKNNKKYSYYAITWMLLYQGTGFVQKERAENIIARYASKSGHQINNIEAKPSFGNIVLWKVIYSDDINFYVNAVKLGWTHTIFPGKMIKKLNIQNDFPWLENDSQQYEDLIRFNWFSNNYLALSKNNNNIIYDIRFSTIPNEVEGLWGIRLDRNKKNNEHIEYITNRSSSSDRYYELIDMILK